MTHKNLFYALLTVFIWSTMATVAKLVLTEIPDLQALSVSSVFSFLFMLALNIFTGKTALLKKYRIRDYLKMSGLGFLGLFLYTALYYRGIAILSSQEACIINYLWPIMILVFSTLILKERLTAKKLIAMLCSFIGLIVMTPKIIASNESGRVVCVIVCVAAAVCYGLFSVLNKKCAYDQSVAMMIIWAVVAVCAFIAGRMTETWVPIRGTQWLGILWLGMIVDALAYYTWALALNSDENTARIANLAYLTPFLSVAISALVLKERLAPTAIIALLLIVGGILIQNINIRKLR